MKRKIMYWVIIAWLAMGILGAYTIGEPSPLDIITYYFCR